MSKEVLKTIGGTILSILFFLLLAYVFDKWGGKKERAYTEMRSKIGIDTLYENDSAYVVRSVLDTVYYEPQEHEVESNRP